MNPILVYQFFYVREHVEMAIFVDCVSDCFFFFRFKHPRSADITRSIQIQNKHVRVVRKRERKYVAPERTTTLPICSFLLTFVPEPADFTFIYYISHLSHVWGMEGGSSITYRSVYNAFRRHMYTSHVSNSICKWRVKCSEVLSTRKLPNRSII